MPGFLCKAHDFVLDRRTVARPAALNLPRIHRCPAQIRSDQPMHLVIGVSDVAIHLLLYNSIRAEAEGPWIGVAGLRLTFREVDRSPIQSARRARLESRELNAAGVE